MSTPPTPLDLQIQALIDQYRARAEANLGLLEEVLKALSDADRANEFMVRRIAKALSAHHAMTSAPPSPAVRPAQTPGYPQPQYRVQ